MLSLFPSLLTYSMIGPFLIRLVVGGTLAFFGYKKVVKKGQSTGSNSTTYGALEIFIALFIIVGLYTQLAALLNVVILVIKLGYKVKDGKFLSDGVNYYLLLLVMALSLVFTGPGFFAFDLPL
jgi:uncharacterized membrane protein YphA (DoxX/SURF4 family)